MCSSRQEVDWNVHVFQPSNLFVDLSLLRDPAEEELPERVVLRGVLPHVGDLVLAAVDLALLLVRPVLLALRLATLVLDANIFVRIMLLAKMND